MILSFLSDDYNSLNNIKDYIKEALKRLNNHLSKEDFWVTHSIMKKFNEIKNSPFIQRIKKKYDSDHNEQYVNYLLKLKESEYNFFDYLDHFISCIIAFLSLGYAPYESNLDLKEDIDEFVKFFTAYKEFEVDKKPYVKFVEEKNKFEEKYVVFFQDFEKNNTTTEHKEYWRKCKEYQMFIEYKLNIYEKYKDFKAQYMFKDDDEAYLKFFEKYENLLKEFIEQYENVCKDFAKKNESPIFYQPKQISIKSFTIDPDDSSDLDENISTNTFTYTTKYLYNNTDQHNPSLTQS